MNVKWTRKALLNLNAEAEYIARDKPVAAKQMVKTIETAVDFIAEHPSGRAGRVPGTREFIVPQSPYIIPYRVKDGQVEILRIFHAARRWPEDL